MENSSVKENVKLLMKELSLLMRIRPGGGEAENHRWSKIVQSSELEVHSTCKKFHELRNSSNTDMEIAKVELNTEVIHLMKHVKCLQECGNVQLLKRDQESDKPKMYSYKELGSLTGDFSTEIGSGGYANVYKGELPTGTDIAVKVLKEKDDLDTFYSELSTLGRNSNRYLVKLYGYCFEKEKKALVYEYMENGSFGNILYGNPRGLDWKKFYEIGISIAEGLSYLHHDCLETIIHYDIKPANVLIDSNLSPKIADFGSAKFMNQCLTHRTNTGLKGTENFVAPEVMYPGFEVNEKSDVYSFGMLLFEILGTKRLDRSKGWFPREVYKKLKAGELDQILKASHISQENSDDARILSAVALWCIQFKPTARPSMNKVVKMLRKKITLRSPPDPFSQFAESSMPRIQEEAYSKSPPSTYDESSFRLHGRQIEEHIPTKARHISDLSPAMSGYREPESEERPQKSLNEKQQENQDLLIKCISQDLGFSGGRPVAACLIYKCLVHWRSFEVERTSVFDRIIQTIGSAIEVQEKNDTLSYWLSNSSTLLLLLHCTLKASGAGSLTPQRRGTSASLFGKMSRGLRGSLQSGGISFLNGRMLAGLDDMRQVEAKYPALLFKQQLSAFLEKIYKMIRNNLKKEISPMLSLCIQAPRTSRASLVKGSRSQANNVAWQALIAHWQSIVKVLNTYLKTLRANYVPPFLVRKVFTQIFSVVNAELFNSLLLRRECCSFSNGEFVKSGLAELEQWCMGATEEYAGLAWDELSHIRQAVGFLVIHQKPKKTLNEITKDLCPVLSIQQLYRISTMYWDDKYGTHGVSSDALSSMRVQMTEESNNAVDSSFLLEDDSSISFTVDDISKSMQQIDIADIDPPPQVLENSGLVFLLQRTD